MIIYQNFKLPHTCSHHRKKPICDMILIKFFTWFTNLFQSYGITMFGKYYNSKRIKNQFNHSLSIFSFLNMLWHTFFWCKYTSTSHYKKLKNVVFLAFDFFGFWPTIICKRFKTHLKESQKALNVGFCHKNWRFIYLFPFETMVIMAHYSFLTHMDVKKLNLKIHLTQF
jgi:hypothetical protein